MPVIAHVAVAGPEDEKPRIGRPMFIEMAEAELVDCMVRSGFDRFNAGHAQRLDLGHELVRGIEKQSDVRRVRERRHPLRDSYRVPAWPLSIPAGLVIPVDPD